MRAIIPAVFILFLLPAVLKAQTMSFNPVADNSMYQDQPANSNGGGYHLFSGNTGGGSPRRALLKFNIAIPHPPENAIVITSATLTLHLNKTRSGSTNTGVYKVLSDWGEGGSNAGGVGGQEGTGAAATVQDATWVCSFANGAGGCAVAWPTAGGNFNPLPSAVTAIGPGIANYSWSSSNMVADVQDWINNPGNNFGWIVLGNESISTTADRFSSRENPTAADRPVLSVTYNLLPVKLSLFNAVETKNGNLLSWQTAQEIDNAFFSVEHSSDGRTFSPIGRVAGNGTSSLAHSYTFLHDGVSRGIHYYRLAQTDINGRIDYSPIVTVTNEKKIYTIRITPNPVSDKVNISNYSAPGSRYTVINNVGASLISGELRDNTVYVGQLPKGSYFILLETKSGEVFRGCFLKQ